MNYCFAAKYAVYLSEGAEWLLRLKVLTSMCELLLYMHYSALQVSRKFTYNGKKSHMFSQLDKDTLSELVANSLTAADSIFFS